MPEASAEPDPPQAGKIRLAINVGIDQQEGLSAEQRARLGEAARGFERLRLARVGDAQAVARAVADALHDALGEVRHVDHGFAAAAPRQALEVPGEERLATRLDERLGNVVGQGTQPLPPARREDHGLHSSSSRSLASGASAA